MKQMIINGIEILPGEEKKIDVNIAKLPSASSIDTSIIVSRAKKEGPVLLLMGGLHGDEINGVEIVRRIIHEKINKPLIGTVICIPVLNVYGFIHFSRYVPDGKDVNRSFPGNKNGSLAARVAHYLLKDIIPQIDYGIDFHTGGADLTNYPQVRCVFKDEESLTLSKAFAAPFLINSPFRPNSLRQAASRLGKKVIVYEGGESSRFDQYAIDEGVRGAKRVMKHLKMHAKAQEAAHEIVTITSSSWVRAKQSGLFHSLVQYGQAVSKNQQLGYITDPFGQERNVVKSGANGYVVGLNNNPLVHRGDAVVHVGIEEEGKDALGE